MLIPDEVVGVGPVTVILLEVRVYPLAVAVIVVLLFGNVKLVDCPLVTEDGRVIPVALSVTGIPDTADPVEP